MSNTIKYKGYVGSVEFSAEDALFYGKVLGVPALISYEGQSVDDLVKDFHEAVDDYLSVCEAEGIAPVKPCEGLFTVSISPELHMRAIAKAATEKITLNRFIERSIEQALLMQSP